MDTNGVRLVTEGDDRKRFIEFPYHLYKDDPNWIPPLRMDQRKLIDPKKNPFFNNAEIVLFLAEKNGKPAGRIAAIIDHRFNEYHGSKTGHFGFFECINDQATANLLFKVAGDWMSDKGMDSVIGPASPSMMDTIGVLVDGFDKKPYIMMPYNKPYYNDLITNAGLQKEMGMFAYVVDDETVSMDRIKRAGQIVMKRNPGLEIRPVNLKKMDSEAQIIREIFNQAWAQNWGFIPLSEAEMAAAAKDLKMIVDPDFACIAEVDGKPIAFSVGLPDFNQLFEKMNGNLFPFGIFRILFGKKKVTRMRTALMGVIPEYQGRGIDALLHQRSIELGPAKGVKESELSWILETNVEMIRVAEKIGGRRDKTYSMYGRKL